jgi:hypothetical protein
MRSGSYSFVLWPVAGATVGRVEGGDWETTVAGVTQPAIDDCRRRRSAVGLIGVRYRSKFVTGQVRLHFFPQTTVQNFLDSGI